MRAILLAAGVGSRLGFLTEHQPKAAVKVGNKPLILRTFEFARQTGVSEVVVVGGCNSHVLWKLLEGERVTKVENPDFRKGNLYSLAAARRYLDSDFVLMNIDHLYPGHLARMIRETSEGIWAVSDFDRPLYHDDMKIRVTGNPYDVAYLTAISKGLEEYDGGYCGITIVKGGGCVQYGNAFDHVLQQGREQAVVEDILAELIRLSNPPKVLNISGIRWLEIDTQEDLANAERILRMNVHFLN